jgi:MFS family permease
VTTTAKPTATIVTSSDHHALTLSLPRLALAVSTLAGSSLALQLALTRAFSLLFAHQAVFLIVSVAVMGLGLGAAIAQRRHDRDSSAASMGVVALIASFSIALLAVMLGSIDQMAFAILLTLPPNMLLGWLVARVYARRSERVALLYSADLIGAGFGLLLGLLLVTISGPFTTILGVAALVAMSAIALGLPRPWLIVAGAIMLLAPANAVLPLARYDPTRIEQAPPDKTLVHVLRNPDLNAKWLESSPSAFAQLDVVSVGNDEQRFVFSDGGAGSIMLPANYDEAKLERETAYLPFQTGNSARTLIIGAGAGFDVRMARRAGAQQITALELNPAMVALTRARADYNGGVLDAPGVRTIVGEGRHFVERSSERFDLIYLNVVYSQAAAPSSATLSENYAFTSEAFRAYWDKLEPNGRLGIVAHNGIEGVKLLLTALKMLESRGLTLPQALRHVALVMTNPGDDPENAPSVLVLRRQPWSTAQADQFAQSVITRDLRALYIPHEFEHTLGVMQSGKMNIEAYLKANPQFDLEPTSDNRPFFYHLEPGRPALLTTTAILGAVALIAFIGYALIRVRRERTRANRLIIDFALIGVAFMLVEVVLLKRFELLLGHPTTSLLVVVGGLLLGGGLGAWLTDRTPLEHLRRLAIGSSLLAAVLLLGVLFGSSLLTNVALPLELPVRILLVLLVTMLIGISLGTLFPSRLRQAAKDAHLIPLCWGVNAIAANFGGAIAMLLAFEHGFSVVLSSAVLVYLLIAASFWLTRRI